MSMSSLQAQLAGLSGSAGKHPGSTYASSKRHTEAIGRGLGFSVQHGHHVAAAGPKFKPSLIQPTAREAADVPLQVLQENCTTAIQEMSDLHPPILDLHVLTGKQPASEETIRDTLICINSLLGEKESSIQQNCLHVLEYMLRRYELHVNYMEDFVWTFLPHANQLTAIFHRVLQMVDLASHQSYLWLRPYADPKQHHTLPRQLVAQHVMRHADLIRRVGRLASTQATLHTKEETESTIPRRGIAHVLSYTAAILVEGLSWQATVEHKIDQEAVLRNLLPHLLSACAARECVDWTGWGYVVSSVVAETMELAPSTISTLTVQMIHGATHASLEAKADALAAVLSILVPPQQQQNVSADQEESSYLPLINGKLLGCDLPVETFQAVLSWNRLSVVLGHLHSDRNMIVAPFVAALVVLGISQKQVDLLTALISEESLGSLWQDARLELVASMSSWIVSRVVEDEKDTDKLKVIIRALHGKDNSACEQGIAHAIQNSSSVDAFGSRQQMANLLDGVVPMDIDESPEQDDEDVWKLLPPRVALEHAVPSVRLQAIERLSKSMSNEDTAESLLRRWSMDDEIEVALASSIVLADFMASTVTFVKQENYERLTDLALSGVHRWNQASQQMDPDEVRLVEKSLYITAWLAQAISKLQVASSRTNHSHVLVEAIAAHLDQRDSVVAELASKYLLLAVDSHSTSSRRKKDSSAESARKCLITNESFIRMLRKNYSQTLTASKLAESTFRRRCLWVVLESLVDNLENQKVAVNTFIDVVNLCLLALNSRDSSGMSPAQYNLLKKCLENGASKLPCPTEQTPATIEILVHVESEEAFIQAARPAVEILSQNVKDNVGDSVSPIAVLMELALRPGNPVYIKRLVSLAIEQVQSDGEAVWFGVVPALALLEDSDSSVRVASVQLLEQIGKSLAKPCTGKTREKWQALSSLCTSVLESKSTAEMGGASFLCSLLSGLNKYHNATDIRESLLSLCVFAATCSGFHGSKTASQASGHSWLPLDTAVGGCHAAMLVLEALEGTGEEVFPLSVRWNMAGLPLFDTFVQTDPPEVIIDTSSSLSGLMESVVKMLKGVTIKDPRVVISSGPSSYGRRMRSYSVGKDGVTVISPYPKEMHDAFIKVMVESHENPRMQMLASYVVQHVLASKSWAEGVFKKLSKTVRKRVAAAILLFVSHDSVEIPQGLFAALPFDSVDISGLLEDLGRSSQDLASLSLLTDFIRANARNLAVSLGAEKVVTLLFEKAKDLSSSALEEDVDGLDFTCQSLLSSLDQIFGADDLKLKGNKKLTDWVDTLLGLLGTRGSIWPLTTFRARSIALSLLTKLCSLYPEGVTNSLLDALASTLSTLAGKESDLRRAGDVFRTIVPAFWTNASAAGLSLVDLLRTFVSAVEEVDSAGLKAELFREMASALFGSSVVAEDVQDASVGALIACFLAAETSTTKTDVEMEDKVQFAVEILGSAPPRAQMASLLMLLQFAKSFLGSLKGVELRSTTDARIGGLPSHDDIARIAFSSVARSSFILDDEAEYSPAQREAIIVLCHSILQAFNNGLLLGSVRSFIRKSDGAAASVCLCLWQDLLVTAQHASIEESEDKASSQWESIAASVDASRDYLQSLLPAHIFLASVTSLMEEGGTVEIRSRALRLVADRALQVEPTGPEASLFVDLVPVIANLLKPEQEGAQKDESRQLILKQSALIALEHIARTLRLPSSRGGRLSTDKSESFVEALGHCVDLLKAPCEELLQSDSEFLCLHSSSRQLISSIGLCTATLVRVVGAHCLPLLPALMKSLVALLTSVNQYAGSFAKSDNSESLEQAKVVQISLLRSVIALVETVPQFLPPHLNMLLAGPAILSKSLRSGGDGSLSAASDRFDEAFASNIPPRSLIPAFSNAIRLCSDASEVLVLLSILKKSIDGSAGAEAIPQRNAVLSIATTSYEFEGSYVERSQVIAAANDALLVLILKLSEIQLRRLFTSLREWKGDFDKSAPFKLAPRRLAFWTLSAALSKELRSIFLPCLNFAVGDAIAELEFAASVLCEPSLSEKTAAGKKKRRLAVAEEQIAYDQESMRSLQPLLLCLEQALRADAHEGGNWVRSDDNQRYAYILEPLGRLLQCRISSDFPVPESVSNTFHYVVEDSGTDNGSVVGCLTALAAAAGNEQLWKPLNFKILDACGNGRSEVRKAGLVCLLSLMKSLGEEYMVLLPECLPVLSELLEDSDEDIAGLAKDAVTLAEELIGESLESSLR